MPRYLMLRARRNWLSGHAIVARSVHLAARGSKDLQSPLRQFRPTSPHKPFKWFVSKLVQVDDYVDRPNACGTLIRVAVRAGRQCRNTTSLSQALALPKHLARVGHAHLVSAMGGLLGSPPGKFPGLDPTKVPCAKRHVPFDVETSEENH